jgi:hypothetical protein
MVEPKVQPNCAYWEQFFFAGYRYRGLNIGNTTDSSSETWALRLILTEATGNVWARRLRYGHLDRYGTLL